MDALILSGNNTATIQVDGSIEQRRRNDRRLHLNQVCFLQRITGAGAIASGWGATGTNTSGGFTRLGRTHTALVADGAGRAMLFWIDNRSSTYAIYGNRVNRRRRRAVGRERPLGRRARTRERGISRRVWWRSPTGRRAFLALSAQGAIYVSADIVVQRVLGAGAKLWGSAGAQITNSANSQRRTADRSGRARRSLDRVGTTNGRPGSSFLRATSGLERTPTLAANNIAVTAASRSSDTVRACGP